MTRIMSRIAGLVALSLVLLGGQGWAQQCIEGDLDCGPVQVARMNPHVLGAGASVSVSTDVCGGADGLVFSWHCENTDVTLGGVAGGVNNGCSAGDTTATTVSGASISGTRYTDGSNSLSFPTYQDAMTFADSVDVLALDTAGTITFDMYITTWASNAVVTLKDSAAGHRITIDLYGTDEMRVRHFSTVDRAAVTSTASVVVNTWYSVVAKWRTGSSPYLCIAVDGVSATGAVATAAFTNGIDIVGFGDYLEGGVYGNIDNIKIYNTWKTGAGFTCE